MLYDFNGSVYISLTNRCPTACSFCVKKDWEMGFRGHDLRLKREPEAGEALAALEARLAAGPAREAVFCGYGECTYRLETMREVGLGLRRRSPSPRVRLNTVGLGSLICNRDITGELAGFLDAVCVSLNTADPVRWRELHRPRPEFAEKGFQGVLAFIAGCVRAGLDTRVSSVDLPGADHAAVEALAKSLGAKFFTRPALA